ncbi:MAG: DNA polymerase III subunit alpha [Planctomycetes bacterium]|nr:DNA polymerase III subunit alpha [Planctomycetota bacterium]
MDGFVHLHVHSHYSLLDGSNRIGDLVIAARQFGMGSLALTDHGNLFGAVEFYKTARAGGIKPILGMEAYISPTTRRDTSMGRIQSASYHLLLLAMNETGWHNLIKLSSRAYLEGFYYRPRIDRELLAELNEGLICTTACLGGEVPSALLAGQVDKARRIAGEYLDIFGRERFFVEIQKQGLADQDRVNPQLVALADELGVELVGTNDVHFLRRDDKSAHEVLTCIATNKTLDDPSKMVYPADIYFKNAREMRQALAQWPQAADNTLKIAEMCDVSLDFTGQHLPAFDTPDGSSPGEYLQKIAWEGLANRFAGREIPQDYRERLERELTVIRDKGYSSYFLIVNDFVQYAHRNDIPAAPRGSGVATLLGYCLGIAEIDPLRYGLLFERFTDPQREEAPDLDIDLCQEGRSKVIQYVREKYGHVAQIITYGTLKAKAVVRDVGRVMDIPLGDVDTIAKLVPDALNMTLDKALAAEEELRSAYDENDQVRQLIDRGRRLEGLARHMGVHAAGVIVAQEPLENLIPLCRQSDSEDIITQWDGPTCDEMGLMKMDFLGLRTLSIIKRARELVRQRTGEDIDPEKIDFTDEAVLELFRKAETEGIFQFESGGMKNVLLQMQPTRIEDLIAANAMYRPGPIELIPSYCARKRGHEEVPTVHPLVDDILEETYGIMAYQEQVMQLTNRLGKIPLNRALTLLKAISKKKAKVIAQERPNFMQGALENGIDQEEAGKLFALILKFAGYGFNKAHSTRYAIVAFQTAYFKVHYPKEFFAATLTYEASDTDKVVRYMADAERMGISIAPPDINLCGEGFIVDGDSVRFGLTAVKGVGAKAVEAIVQARNQVGRFEDLYHFCKNVDLHAVNRGTIEALIGCGAFDSLGAHRAAMSAALDHAITLGQAAAADRKSGQMSFFDTFNQSNPVQARFPDVEPWSEAQLLATEKETLGFYVSSHPLVTHGRMLTSLTCPSGFSLGKVGQFSHETPVTVGCMVAQIRLTQTKSKGERMAILTLEDITGKSEAVVFPRAYERFGRLLEVDTMAFVRGTINASRETPSIVIDEFIPIAEAIEQLTGSILLSLPGAGKDLLEGLQNLLARHKGDCPVFVRVRPVNRGDVLTTIRLARQWWVKPSQALVEELIELLGEKNLRLNSKPPAPSARRGGQFRNKPRARQRSLIAAEQNAQVSPAVTRFN